MVVQPSGNQPWAIVQVRVRPTPNARPGGFNPGRALPNGLRLDDLFTQSSVTGEMPFDLWNRLSFGRLNVGGSRVLGPVDAIREDGMPANTDDWDAMNDDAAANKWARGQKVLSGIRGAIAAGIDLSSYWGVVVVPDYQIDSFGSYGGVNVSGLNKDMGQVLLDYNDLSSARCIHEMGHGFGFDHARGDFNPDPGGDYGDPSDVMSYARCASFTGADGATGPGFSAASLWLRGWLPTDVTWIDARSGIPDATYTLAALYASSLAPGSTRALVIDIASAGRFVDRELYFIEFRDKRGIDAGFARPAVFVHRLTSLQGAFQNNPWLVAPNASSAPGDRQGLVAGGSGWTNTELPAISSGPAFGVGVVAIDTSTDTATVRINPARATISLSDSLETESEREIGFDLEEWPGAILAPRPKCGPQEFEYIVLSRQQRITLTATPAGGLDPTHPVTWSVEGTRVNSSGPVTFVLTYESPQRQVWLDAEVNGHTLVLRNRPADGQIKFYVEASVDPPVPGVGSPATNLQFDGIGRRYENSQRDVIVERCQKESADALRAALGKQFAELHPGPGGPPQHLNGGDIERIIGALHRGALG